MKTLIKTIAASMFVAGALAVSSSAMAQVQNQDRDQMEQQNPGQGDRVEVKITEVPSAVSDAITTDYQGWEASKAYKVTDPTTKKVVYEITFTNPQGMTETKKFNEDGEEVEGDDY